MCPQPDTLGTPAAYLDAERRAETKSEYFAGEVFAMSGASRRHNLIVGNLVRELGTQLRGRPCEVYPSDMRVKVAASGAYTYPDVVVVCGEPEFEDEHVDTLLNPTLLVEVLSPSTEVNDRVRNWQQYRRIPSLAEYVLVAQDQQRVEWYTRQQGGLWTFAEAAEADVLTLQSVGCHLALNDVYERAV